MTQPTCTVDGCTRPLHVRKRGFCQYHYLKWWKGEDLTPSPVEHGCAECGEPTTNPTYCSGVCRDLRKWEKRKASPAYEAQKAAKRAAYIPRPKVPKVSRRQQACSEIDCDSGVRSRGLCAKHYRREMKQLGLWSPSPADSWQNPKRRARAAKRKAIKRGATAAGEGFTIADLIERDGATCALCGGDIDAGLTWPHPMYATVDHIVPVSRGGEHSLSNAQPAHFLCNTRAGAKRSIPDGEKEQPTARAA